MTVCGCDVLFGESGRCGGLGFGSGLGLGMCVGCRMRGNQLLGLDCGGFMIGSGVCGEACRRTCGRVGETLAISFIYFLCRKCLE